MFWTRCGFFSLSSKLQVFFNGTRNNICYITFFISLECEHFHWAGTNGCVVSLVNFFSGWCGVAGNEGVHWLFRM